MAAAMESPIVLHALVYAMLRTMLLIRKAPGPEDVLALEHYAQCLQHLKKDMKLIQDGTVSPSDYLLMGIAALAGHGELQPMQGPARDPWVQISPLANRQNIDVYSVGAMESVHMQALYSLTSRRGGLQNISLNGLADAVEVYGRWNPAAPRKDLANRLQTRLMLRYPSTSHPAVQLAPFDIP